MLRYRTIAAIGLGFAAIGLSWLTVLIPAYVPDSPRARRPNIVVILADDLGYGDLHCYCPDRGKIPTPQIDQLAAEGMLFTDAHSSSAVCSPSRYTLLTGRYHWRTRLQSGIVKLWERPLIGPERLTLGKLLQRHGYDTGCFGKWHLGWDWNIPREQESLFRVKRSAKITDRHRTAWRDFFSQPIGGGPTRRGFDVYFGTSVPNWPPYCFIKDDRTVGIPTTFLPGKKFRDHLASRQGPALPDWDFKNVLPTIVDHACGFIKERAAADEPFFLYLPLTSPHTPLAPTQQWQGKSGLNSTAADFIMQTDAEVGQVLQALEEAGVAGETIVIFTSDNGFAHYVGAKHLEARGHYPSGPLRGYKTDAWEGGHRIPFIVRWPGVVEPGTVCGQLVHQADVVATVADIMGESLQADAGEDSVSLMPLLKGIDEPIREHAVSASTEGIFALRRGDWKMIFGSNGGDRVAGKSDGPPALLYNLSKDLDETNNLYAECPKKVREMTALLKRLIHRGRSTPGPDQENDVPVTISVD